MIVGSSACTGSAVVGTAGATAESSRKWNSSRKGTPLATMIVGSAEKLGSDGGLGRSKLSGRRKRSGGRSAWCSVVGFSSGNSNNSGRRQSTRASRSFVGSGNVFVGSGNVFFVVVEPIVGRLEPIVADGFAVGLFDGGVLGLALNTVRICVVGEHFGLHRCAVARVAREAFCVGNAAFKTHGTHVLWPVRGGKLHAHADAAKHASWNGQVG